MSNWSDIRYDHAPGGIDIVCDLVAQGIDVVEFAIGADMLSVYYFEPLIVNVLSEVENMHLDFGPGQRRVAKSW